MRTGIEYDWETREDGNTLKRAKMIENDPARLERAQAYLADESKATLDALGIRPHVRPTNRTRNRATIGTVPMP